MSTGFGFGSKPFGQTQQPTGSITFGTPVATNTTTPAFGTSTQASSLFGTPAKSTNMTFGTPSIGQTNVTATGLSGFGTPSTNTGVSFGAPQPTANTGFQFGGTPAASSSGFAFGAAAPSFTSAPLTFASPATSAPALSFGSTAPASTGLGFGSAATTGAANMGFTFGSTPAPASFGAAATTTSLPFGAPASTQGLTFGKPVATTTTAFGNLFGAVTSAAPSLGLSFGSTSAAPSFNLGTQATTTAASLNFGAPIITQSFGLGGGTSTGLNLTSKPTTAVTTTGVGLGGIASSTPTTSATAGKADVLPRDQPLPNELMQTVENFKTFVKQQKNYSSDVARCSVKEFKRVAADIDLVNSLLNEVEKQLQSNRAVAEKLKHDTAKSLQHVEMAQRTFDTPPGLQYDNTAPLNFFKELVDNFEREMQHLKLQIENTDKYVKNLGKPSPLTSQDLATGMRRLHETFVALAGRLQSVHSQVESQKEHYLNLRKYMFNDDGNVFEKPNQQEDALKIALNSINYKPPKIASGPTPFNSLSHPSVVQAAVQHQNQSLPGTSAIGTQVPSLFGTSSSNLFGGTSFGQPSLQFNSSNTNFQLQKPPVGNKRGKQ